jgi:hypothetical protein
VADVVNVRGQDRLSSLGSVLPAPVMIVEAYMSMDFNSEQ